MIVLEGLENFKSSESTNVTVGSFDGLHLGHQKILNLMKDTGGLTTVLTFEPHPQTIVKPEFPPPPQLTDREERIELFRQIGIDRLLFAKFDEKFAAMSAEEYVGKILAGTLRVRNIFIGPNHKFGRDRSGDVELLRKMGSELNFHVHVVDPVILGDEVVSSSRIRRKLTAGDALTAYKMLGKPYNLIGSVIKGEGRGRKLGFPTANINGISAGKLMPPPGIYSTITDVGGDVWRSVSHIGPRPTFDVAAPTIESHLIDFDGDLYGKEIKIGLIRKQREIIAFDNIKSLISQMMFDREQALFDIEAAGVFAKTT